jgi:hypothetical protein
LLHCDRRRHYITTSNIRLCQQEKQKNQTHSQNRKAIYGAKNSSSAFYRTLVAAVTTSTKLKKFNFKVSDEDPCVFHSTTERGSILLAVQVDDIAALVCDRNKSKLEADGVMKSQLLIDFNRAFDEHFIKEGSTVKSHYASRQEGVQFLGTFIRQHTDVTYSMDMEERIKIACEIVGLDTTENGYPGTPYTDGDTHQWREAESIHKTIEHIEKTIKKVQALHPKAIIKSYDDAIRSFRHYTGNGIWFANTGCHHVMTIISSSEISNISWYYTFFNII